MNDLEFHQLEFKVQSIFIENRLSPIFLFEFDELNMFSSYEEMKSKVSTGQYTLLIPNHMLHHYHKEAILKQYNIASLIFIYAPFFIAALLIGIGIFNGNYWLLITLPIIFIAQFLSGIFTSKPLLYLTLAVGIYLLITSKLILGSVLVMLSSTIICSIHYKMTRKDGFINSAMNSEILFCFLFWVRIISLYDRQSNKVIKRL